MQINWNILDLTSRYWRDLLHLQQRHLCDEIALRLDMLGRGFVVWETSIELAFKIFVILASLPLSLLLIVWQRLLFVLSPH